MPDADDLIRTARDAIGAGDPEKDWAIVLTEHAEMFRDKAPSLAENLRRARPEGLAKMYEDRNRKAMDARDKFKDTVGMANVAIFFTAGFGALLLVFAGLQGWLGGFGHWVIRVIGVLGLVASGLAAMWLSQVRGGSLAGKWAEHRARAEAKRLAYFKAVMEGASDEPLDQLLALEYTRRFLLDNQIDYFSGRGGEHEKAAGRALRCSTRAVFVTSLFTAVAGALAWWHPELAVVAGLGVISSAYAALAVSRSAVNQDRTNADRYLAAKYQLEDMRLDIDTYREKTASGEKGSVQEFLEPVFVILKADHQAFLTETEKRDLAIGGMVDRLDAAKAALERESPGGTDDT